VVEHTADNRAVVGSIPTVPIFANAKKVSQVPAVVLSKLGARERSSAGSSTRLLPDRSSVRSRPLPLPSGNKVPQSALTEKWSSRSEKCRSPGLLGVPRRALCLRLKSIRCSIYGNKIENGIAGNNPARGHMYQGGEDALQATCDRFNSDCLHFR